MPKWNYAKVVTSSKKSWLRNNYFEPENLKEGQQKSDFWKELQKFRLTIQNEGLGFTNEDFANLRDRSVGRQIHSMSFQ